MTIRNTMVVETTDITHQGYAMGRVDGKPTFAAYALPGELVEVTLTEERRDYAIGVAGTVLKPSADRAAPPCPYFSPDGCGGCQWQHADYAAQLRYKTRIVAEQFRRIGRLPAAEVRPAIASPAPYAYRTHATFSVNPAGALCFVGPDGETLQPIDQCLLLRPELQALLARLHGLNFRGAKRVRLQSGSDPGDLAVILSGEPNALDPISAALDGASLVIQQGEETRAITARTWLTYTIAGRSFRASAGGFFQVNLAQAQVLVRLVQDQVPERVAHVVDLYAGVGLFTAFLAERAQKVTSIEEYRPAVRDARRNLAGFGSVDARVGAVEQAIRFVARPVDVVVTDPPRAGMKGDALAGLLALQPTRIVYVSCEPSTLARDARQLVESGYRLDFVQPVDMFPQTYHIESVAVFTRS